jgi:hypothetical protein
VGAGEEVGRGVREDRQVNGAPVGPAGRVQVGERRGMSPCHPRFRRKEARMKRLALMVLVSLLAGGVAEAAPTKVVVRAKAKDAKFIGSSMGGAFVVLRDRDTGEVLAKGFTTGGTGNTQKIMADPLRRGASITDEDTAKFEAVVDLSEPKLITIEVHAPYGQWQSITKNTAQLWLIPGRDVPDEGIIIDVYGFSVEVLSPQPHETIKLADGKATVPVRANVVMMCGCPITPNGMWDANKYEVKAIVKRNGVISETTALPFANKTNTFGAALEIAKEGAYEVTVYAFDPVTGNAGVHKSMFTISK